MSLGTVVTNLPSLPQDFPPAHYEYVLGSTQLFEVSDGELRTSEKFQELLALLHRVGLIKENYLSDLNGALQEGLLRRGERWEQQSKEKQKKLEAISEQVKDCLVHLGFVGAEMPKASIEVDEVIVFGARVERMRQRIQHTIDLENSALLKYKKVTLLGSNRELSDEEQSCFDKPLPKDEAEAIQRLWRDCSQSCAKVIRSTENGTSFHEDQGTRPTTQSTLNDWLPTCQAKSIFAVVEKPYLRLGDQLRWSLFRSGKEAKVLIASPESTTKDLVIYLDELARQVYSVKRRLSEIS